MFQLLCSCCVSFMFYIFVLSDRFDVSQYINLDCSVTCQDFELSPSQSVSSLPCLLHHPALFSRVFSWIETFISQLVSLLLLGCNSAPHVTPEAAPGLLQLQEWNLRSAGGSQFMMPPVGWKEHNRKLQERTLWEYEIQISAKSQKNTKVNLMEIITNLL